MTEVVEESSSTLFVVGTKDPGDEGAGGWARTVTDVELGPAMSPRERECWAETVVELGPAMGLFL